MAKLPIPARKRAFTSELMLLEQALSRIANTAAAVLADKKLVASEYVQIFGEFPDILSVLQLYKPAYVYFKALSAEEKEFEIGQFAAMLEIPQEDARVKINAVFTNGAKIYAGFSKMYDGVMGIHKAFSQHHTTEPDQPAAKPASKAQPKTA